MTENVLDRDGRIIGTSRRTVVDHQEETIPMQEIRQEMFIPLKSDQMKHIVSASSDSTKCDSPIGTMCITPEVRLFPGQYNGLYTTTSYEHLNTLMRDRHAIQDTKTSTPGVQVIQQNGPGKIETESFTVCHMGVLHGTTVNAIGKFTPHGDLVFTISKEDKKPMYVTTRSMDEICTEWGNKAWWKGFGAITFGIVAADLSGFAIHQATKK